MNILSLSIIAIALSLEFFSIAQRFGFFLNKQYIRNLLIYFISIIVVLIVFGTIGASIGYLIESVFKMDAFLTFIILLSIVAIKYLYEASKRMHIKKTINPVFINNLIGLIVPVGLNILMASISISLFYSTSQIVIFLTLFSLLFSFIGFFVGSFLNRLLNLRLELFSGLLIIGVVVKHLMDYFLMK